MENSTLAVTGDSTADDLVRTNAFALLLAMQLDQQISIEMAFRGPARLAERISQVSAVCVASLPEDDLVAAFREKPALHRFPAAMARRAQALAQHVVDTHGGDAAAVWTQPDTAEDLATSIRSLPGFGDEKTMIFVALLAKRMGVAPRGWQTHAGPFADDQPRSVADVDGPESMDRVKAWKKQQRALGKSKQQ